MTTITARGMFDQRETEVICAERDGDMTFLFDKHKDMIKEDYIRSEMAKRHLIAGTYTPEMNSMLNVLNVIQFHFFDDPPDINTTGDFEEMPSDDGVVY